MLTLRLLNGVEKGKTFKVSGDRPEVLGRHAPLVKLDDSRVSRQHAEITRQGQTWAIRDLGSSNGTFVNRKRIARLTELEEGDELLIGRLRIKVAGVAPQAAAVDDAGPPQPVRLEMDDAEEAELLEASGSFAAASVFDDPPQAPGSVVFEIEDDDEEDEGAAEPEQEPAEPGVGPVAAAVAALGGADDDQDDDDVDLAALIDSDADDDGGDDAIDFIDQVLADLDNDTPANAPDTAVEEAARREAEQQARRDAEEAARLEAEQQARRDAEEAARLEAEQQARRDAEEAARLEAEQQARRDAEEAARLEAEEQAKREAEEAARREVEAQARREAEERAQRVAAAQGRLRDAVAAFGVAAGQVCDTARSAAAEAARQAAARLEAEAQAQREAEAAEQREAQARREAMESQAAARREAHERARRDSDTLRRSREGERRRAIDVAGHRALALAQARAEAAVRRAVEAEARRRAEAEAHDRAAEARQREREARREAEARQREQEAREQAEARQREAAHPQVAADAPHDDQAPATYETVIHGRRHPDRSRPARRRLRGIGMMILMLAVGGLGAWLVLSELGTPPTVAGREKVATEPTPTRTPVTATPSTPADGEAPSAQDARIETAALAFADGPAVAGKRVLLGRVHGAGSGPLPAQPGTGAPASQDPTQDAAPPHDDPRGEAAADTPLATDDTPATDGQAEPPDAPPGISELEADPEPGVGAEAPGDEADPTPVAPPAADEGERLAILVDASGSTIDSMPMVIAQLGRMLDALGPADRFTVIFFREGEAIEAGVPGLQLADAAARRRVWDWIQPEEENIRPAGRSDVLFAMQLAMSYQVQRAVILSDDSFGGRRAPTDRVVESLEQVVGQRDVRVDTMQFVYPDDDQTLAAVAKRFGGVYRFIEPAREEPADAGDPGAGLMVPLE